MTAFIDEHRDAFGVEPIRRALQVAPSTYWARKRAEREPAARTLADRELLVEIRRIYDKSKGLYGARKVWWQLRRDGINAPRCAVERLMRSEGLTGVVRGKKRRTTLPGDQGQRPADLVDRDFTASEPNRLWVADFTYVMTWSGVVYVAFVIDAFSRRIVGWKADTSMKTALVLDTLEMALWSRQRDGIPLTDGMVFHNDAGSQCLSFAFTSRLIDAGVDASVGSVGHGYRQRAGRDHHRPVQDREDPPRRTVAHPRRGRAGHPGMGRLVQPRPAALRLRRSPSRRV